LTLSESFAGKKQGIVPNREKKSGIGPAEPPDKKREDNQKSRSTREEYAGLFNF